MNLTEVLVEFLTALAWLAAVLAIALIYRRLLYGILEHIGGIAERAKTDQFELSIGEKLKLVLARALEEANPKSVDEAVAVARGTANRALSLADILNEVPLKKHERDVLAKIAGAGAKGLVWRYGGDPSKAPGRTMGSLVRGGLVSVTSQ